MLNGFELIQPLRSKSQTLIILSQNVKPYTNRRFGCVPKTSRAKLAISKFVFSHASSPSNDLISTTTWTSLQCACPSEMYASGTTPTTSGFRFALLPNNARCPCATNVIGFLACLLFFLRLRIQCLTVSLAKLAKGPYNSFSFLTLVG